MPYSRTKLLALLFASACIIFVLILVGGPKGANHFGWGWHTNLPDHVYYHDRDYALVNSGCITVSDIAKNTQQITPIETLYSVFGPSYTVLAPSDQAKENSFVFKIFVEKQNNCYISYGLEGSP